MTVEQEIKKYVKDAFHQYTEEQVERLQLPKLLSLVEMRDKDKYDEFRKTLRKEGWII
jgi:hypothetical protein